ncbi:MAG: NBR1-Ig-like domain-containing protein [Methylobacter sp.]|uniref:NBR1-Ig-like domain-containing protein n=1 Tax=Methylobacter sp. TaxID=2051955 RepID=UPI00271720B6|nr:NBR1-Ig-like domain-containing protein [Methylobacter sp.]MDO9269642.1 NBR1-Ig-like domain-containing protein [Methylobacter sp.]MDP1665636.1 NBR1-Ig-like domain-containing protein [Methylobacter sp.]
MPLYELSEYVKQRINTLGLSMSELARQTGISRQGLYGLLDGTTGQAKISTLIALAKALQVHPMVLFRHLLHQLDLPKFSTTSAKYQFDASGFVQDVTIPDNTTVLTDQVFTKIWEIQNIGHIDWLGRKMVCVDQNVDIPAVPDQIVAPEPRRGLVPTRHVIDIPKTLPGDSVILSVEFTAPSYPCSLVSYWKMIDENEEICFPATEGLSCMVRVISL